MTGSPASGANQGRSRQCSRIEINSVFLKAALYVATFLFATVFVEASAASESDISSIEQPRMLLFPAIPGSSGAKNAGAISTTEMAKLFGLETLEVLDMEFQRPKRFEGVALRKLLEYVELEVGEQLVFVATDGYQINFDSSLLLQSELNALIAFRDLEASENLNWELFQHGRELVNFDPFYLVWAIEGDDFDNTDTQRLYSLPWPYQLNEIRVVSADQYAAAAPTMEEGERAHSGFDLYVKHCIKCHQVKGLGGELGPAIDREHSWASLIEASVLKDIIWKIKDYVPETKMPDYRDVLSEQDAEDLVIYMQSVQSGKPSQ